MRLSFTTRRVRLGFTLTELLVIVAVLAILLSLLLPSLNRAKESGRSVVCKGNIHQLMLGMVLYADENNDFLPWPGGTGNRAGRNLMPDWVFGGKTAKVSPEPKNWILPGFATHAESGSIFNYVVGQHRVLPFDEKYTNSFPVYRCPASDLLGLARRVTYSMNAWLDPSAFPDGKEEGVQRSAVVSPASKILVVDESQDTAHGGSFLPSAAADASQLSEHNGRANVGFIDIHLESIKHRKKTEMLAGGTGTKMAFDPYSQ